MNTDYYPYQPRILVFGVLVRTGDLPRPGGRVQFTGRSKRGLRTIVKSWEMELKDRVEVGASRKSASMVRVVMREGYASRRNC